MPRSTKISTNIVLGDTADERDRRLNSLREIASYCGYTGRYGGNISELLCAIADLPEEDRKVIAGVLQKFLK
jgi:hypothetical protein